MEDALLATASSLGRRSLPQRPLDYPQVEYLHCSRHCHAHLLYFLPCDGLASKSCPTLLWPQGLWPTRLLYTWDFPGKNTGVGYYFLLPKQGLNPHLLCCSIFFTAEPPGWPSSIRLSCSLISFSCLFTFKTSNQNMEHPSVPKAKGR